MNKLYTGTPPMEHLSKAESDTALHLLDLRQSSQLIVLIPVDSDYTHVTSRIWELANASNSTIQLLGMCKESSQEPSLRRQLVTMAALIQGAKVSIQTKVEIGTNWVDAIKRHYQPGDMIVCTTEQRMGIQRKPLSQILESNFNAPVYVLSDPSPELVKSDRLSQVIVWLGFVGIVVGFFILQARVIELSDDGLQTVLLTLLLVPEFWLIQLWNNLFG